jgi:hypothetical protein
MMSERNRLVRMAPELAVRTILIALAVMFLQAVLLEFFDFPVPGLVWLAAAAALWVPMTAGLYGRAGEAVFAPRRELTRQQKLRRWAGAMWMAPLGVLPLLWLLPFYRPSLLIEQWGLYLLFFGIPFAGAAALYLYAARVDAQR